jgi:hypothetical protein
MKRLIILTVIVLVTITSCGRERNPDDFINITPDGEFIYIESDDEQVIHNFLSRSNDFQYYDGYLYFFGHTLFRYNTRTGNITTVCQDALCNHDIPSCPFFGSIGNVFINNSNIHFIRSYNHTSNGNRVMNREFGTYDLKTMRYTVRDRMTWSNTFSEYNKQLFTDSYRYFYDYMFDEEQQQHFFQIARMDLRTNKITALNPKEEIADTDIFNKRFLFVIENRIYFTDINTIYSTDLDLNDGRFVMDGNFIYDDIFTDGTYIFYGVPTDTPFVVSIHRVNWDGTNNIELGIITNVNEWTITKNYIYYASPFRKILGSNTKISFFSDAIVRSDYDGNNKVTVYQADNDEETGLYIQLHGYTINGNYIYSNYYTFDEINEIYYSNLGEGYFLRINMIDSSIERINTN